MPVIRDSLDPDYPTTITLYTRNEIFCEMRRYRHLHTHDIKNNRMWYVAAKVRCENEALVLIALMMRESDTKPAQFFFEDRINTVFASCEFSGAPYNVAKEKFKKVIDQILGNPSLSYLKKDFRGDPIFFEHGVNIEPEKEPEKKIPNPTVVTHPDEALVGPMPAPKKPYIPDTPSLFKFAHHYPFGGGNMAFDVHDPEITE